MTKSTPTTRQIRAMRASRGHSAREAALAVGVHIRTWQRWELGECAPDAARLQLYALGLPVVTG